ncbi:MAG: DUF3597 domain-containing protein [Pseudomonadota bacterium]
MSFFGKILDKLGFHSTAKPTDTAAAPSPTVASSTPSVTTPGDTFSSVSSPASHTESASVNSTSSTVLPSREIPIVDVAAQLESLSATQHEKLNWKTSIVDLLKLLGLDSSLTSRKELATELNCPSEKMNDSAQMNMWLHKTVLQKLAQNGGKVPAELIA